MPQGRDLTLFKTALLRMLQVNKPNDEQRMDKFNNAELPTTDCDHTYDWVAMEKELGEFTAAEFEAVCDGDDELGSPDLQSVLLYIFENYAD